ARRGGGGLEAGGALAAQHAEPFRAPERGLGPRFEIVLGEHLPEPLALALVVDQQTHREALAAPRADLGRERLELAAEAADRARAHGDARRGPVAPLQQGQLAAATTPRDGP